MKREFLKELELEDEVIGKIMAEYGKSVNAIKADADKVDGLQSQIQDYEQQIKDRDKQLEKLEETAKGNEEMQNEIKQLKEENENVAKQWEEKLTQQKKEAKLELALKDAKARNPRAVKALLDSEKISLDGDNIIGLNEQLEALKESDAYLFGEEQTKGLAGRDPVPGNDAPQNKGITKDQFNQMGYQDRAKLYQENPDLYNQLSE